MTIPDKKSQGRSSSPTCPSSPSESPAKIRNDRNWGNGIDTMTKPSVRVDAIRQRLKTTRRLKPSSLQELCRHGIFVRIDESCFLPIQTGISGRSLFLLKMKRPPRRKRQRKRKKSHKNIFLLGKRGRSMYSLAVKIGSRATSC
jgi:hypothetical protein